MIRSAYKCLQVYLLRKYKQPLFDTLFVMKHFIFIIPILICSCDRTTVNKEINKQKTIDSILPVREYKVISDSANILENKIQTLELEYTLWGCACPNWIRTTDAIKYQDSGFLKHHIFIEPADSSLYSPDSTMNIYEENIVVTGQFYVREDYPQGTIEMEEPLPKAKVFRYTKIKRVKRNQINQYLIEQKAESANENKQCD